VSKQPKSEQWLRQPQRLAADFVAASGNLVEVWRTENTLYVQELFNNPA